MVDYLIYLLVVSLVTVSILRVWFTSELMAPLLTTVLDCKYKLLKQENPDEQTTEVKPIAWYKYPLWFVLSVMTCWQCSSYWVSWAVAALTIFFIPNTPIGIFNIGGIFISGVFAAYVSEYLHMLVERSQG